MVLCASVAVALRRKQVDLELEDELRDHLAQQIKENLAAGMSPEEARTLSCHSDYRDTLPMIALPIMIAQRYRDHSWLQNRQPFAFRLTEVAPVGDRAVSNRSATAPASRRSVP